MKLNHDFLVPVVTGVCAGYAFLRKGSLGEHVLASFAGLTFCVLAFAGSIVLGIVINSIVNLFSKDLEDKHSYDNFHTSLLTSAIWGLVYIYFHL
jgi:hypothetical protein